MDDMTEFALLAEEYDEARCQLGVLRAANNEHQEQHAEELAARAMKYALRDAREIWATELATLPL